MRRRIQCAAIVLFASGCAQRTYEIDFSQVEDFAWTGKVQVTETAYPRFGLLGTVEEDWRVDRITLTGEDGRTASIDVRQSGSAPDATVELSPPGGTHVLGAPTLWTGSGIVVVMDPACAAREATERGEVAPEALPDEKQGSLRPAPFDRRPYREHVDELTLADWWAIALTHATDVFLRFDLPTEGLQVVMRGNPRRYGPEVLEVETTMGILLKRYEREQAPAIEIRPADGN